MAIPTPRFREPPILLPFHATPTSVSHLHKTSSWDGILLTLRYVGIDACSEKETSSVLDACVVGRDQHDEANNGRAEEADHEDATSLHAIREPATRDTEDTCHNVWRHGHQLSSVIGISQRSDDRWQEKRDRVERCVAADGDEPVLVSISATFYVT